MNIYFYVDVYFFLYHNEILKDVPRSIPYSLYMCDPWSERSREKFVGSDIPIIIVGGIEPSKESGGKDPAAVTCGWTDKGWTAIMIEGGHLRNPILSINILSHELLHIFGFDETEIASVFTTIFDRVSITFVSVSLRSRIQKVAIRFQMDLTDTIP